MHQGPQNQHLVTAVIGADRFIRREAIEAVLRALSSDDDDGATTRVDGADAVLADVLDELRTPSLLGDRRIVVVDEADPFVSEHRLVLERYCTAPCGTGRLVLSCQSMATNTKIHRIISKSGAIVACAAPKRRAVTAWILDRVRKRHGKRMDASAAALLREHIGDELGILASELEKLTSYVGSRAEITVSDVDLLVGHSRQEKVFGVIDAIFSGDVSTALAQWEQVMATDRAAPGRAVGGLAWGVRALLDAYRDWQKGLPLMQHTKKLWTDAQTLALRLKRTTEKRLESALSDLLEVDLAVKTGLSTVESAVEKFIVTHTHVRQHVTA